MQGFFVSTTFMNATRLIYLHGFNSSPASYKSTALQAYMAEKGMQGQLISPAIPPVPADALELLVDLYESNQQHGEVAVAGSSLGGFYATCLAERFGCKAVLINPAVRPHLLLAKYLGENINYYTSDHWMLDKIHIEQLRQMDVEPITNPDRYLLLLQKGDETLDYRQALEKYGDCPRVCEEGGNHSFAGFENYIEQLLKFCTIST